jgi:hypothetical protein
VIRTPLLPDLPKISNDARLVAGLYRELQRDAGERRAFICPVNTIAQFAGLRWPEQARWIQTVLEKAGVIQCVDRGLPHVAGAKGKSTLWRYLRPL